MALLSIQEILNSIYVVDENGVPSINTTSYDGAPVGLVGRDISQPLLSVEEIMNSILTTDVNGLPAIRLNIEQPA